RLSAREDRRARRRRLRGGPSRHLRHRVRLPGGRQGAPTCEGLGEGDRAELAPRCAHREERHAGTHLGRTAVAPPESRSRNRGGAAESGALPAVLSGTRDLSRVSGFMAAKKKIALVGATGIAGQQFVAALAGHPWFDIT